MPGAPFETIEIRGLAYRKDPAREACFRVVHDDAEMVRLPGMSAEARRERLHRHMNNEIGSLEIAAQTLADFPEAPWDLRMELARQCWDETRHVGLLHRRLTALGGRKGEFPVANFEWRVTCMLDSLAARLAVQNRTFEAGQMDIVRRNIEEWREAGDGETAAIIEGILADEIQHVRFANRWLRRLIASDRKLLMKVVSAMRFLERATAPPEGSEEAPARPASINIEDRRLAEFTEEEIGEVLRQVGLASLETPPRDERGSSAGPGAPGAACKPEARLAASPGPKPDVQKGSVIHRGAGVPGLIAADPARDSRFRVVDRWEECVNLPDDHPERGVEFLHRQMNEEIDGLENSARCLADFPATDWHLRMQIARQCADEARHITMFRGLCERRGGRVGAWPVMNFQYRIINRIDSLEGRLAVQNRSFEAEGIDAIRFGIDDCRRRGDAELEALLDAQLADEIGHVRYANEWLRLAIRESPRAALVVARALAQAAEAFSRVVGVKGGHSVKYLVDREVRLEAGFSEDEVRVADESVRARRLGHA